MTIRFLDKLTFESSRQDWEGFRQVQAGETLWTLLDEHCTVSFFARNHDG